ncbi:MAG: N-terminal phage integrase SAM-like domain-containing protein, partial [Acidobacteriota bacterium]
MQGQIIEKAKGTWLLRIQKRMPDGKRRSFSETFQGTKSDARKRLTQKLAEIDSASPSSLSTGTLNEFLDVWLETIAKPRVQLRTYEDYRDLMRLHVRDTIGNLPLTKLQALHIQKLYAGLQNDRKLSARRIRYVHSVLSSALKKAVEMDLVMRNV